VRALELRPAAAADVDEVHGWLRREWVSIALLVAMLALRLVVVWHATWIPVSDSRDYHAYANGAPWVQSLYAALHRLDPATYGLAFAGGLLLLVQRRSLRGLWALFAAYVLLHAAVSFSDIRFAAPLYSLMCLAAGFGLTTAGTWGWALLRRSGIVWVRK